MQKFKDIMWCIMWGNYLRHDHHYLTTHMITKEEYEKHYSGGKSKTVDDIPRRIRIDLMTPAERAIWEAIGDVEDAGGHPFLTEAVVLLQQAREKVADYVERTV